MSDAEAVAKNNTPEEVISPAKPAQVPLHDAGSPDKVPEGYILTKNGVIRRKRRTRAQIEADGTGPRGTQRSKRVKDDASDVVADIANEDLPALLANTTMGIHAMLAEVVDPKCALTESQARIEGEAIARIMEQYKMDPDGKYLPWLVLVGTLMLCETPTAVVITRKMKESRADHNKGQIVKGEIIDGTAVEVTGEATL
jgi:hypothetical protein